ncbi:MAG: GAF domain-containing protein [Sandaracinaceae bacterium]|nr:GAF domain-containing protein [Sandaracinaceae bacterium]
MDAELALRAGKIEAARRGLEEAWAEQRTPPAVRATVGARLAIVRAVGGDVAAASALLEQLDPSGAEAEHAIARARVRLAAGADAAGDAERALAAAAHLGWETRLRAELIASEALERAGRGADAAACLARARVLIDRAAASLPVRARALLRAVPAYQRALASAPGAPREAGGDRWRALTAHAKRLAREPRVPRLREAIVDAAIEIADAERGFLVTRAADGGLRVLAARAFGAELAGERPSESVAARVLDGGRPLVTVDAQGDERLGRAASMHAMALRSVLAVPIPVRGGRALALVLDDRVRPGAFDEETVALARDLADLAASALEGAEALRRERRERRRLARSEERLFARIESQGASSRSCAAAATRRRSRRSWPRARPCGARSSSRGAWRSPTRRSSSEARAAPARSSSRAPSTRPARARERPT